jgi:hypothetical protein
MSTNTNADYTIIDVEMESLCVMMAGLSLNDTVIPIITPTIVLIDTVQSPDYMMCDDIT